MPVVQRKTTDLASRGGRPAEPTGGASSIDGVKANEELRSNHIRTLQVTQSLEKENQRLKQQIAELQQPNARMKQEELDSLYVEERRLIETLERENRDLKQAATDMRAGRDGDASAAKAELQKLSGMCEALRDEKRRDANLAASQLEKIRSAFKAELESKAAECEAALLKAQEMGLEAGVERSRADSLERRLSEAREELAAASAAPKGDGGEQEVRDQLRAAQVRISRLQDAADEATRRAEHAETAAASARAGEAAAREAAAAAEAALEEERKQRRLAEAAHKKELAAKLSTAASREADLRREIARLQRLLEEAERERTAMVLPKVTAPAPAAPPQPPADDGRSVFTDFIGLKRELAALRDENARLRQLTASGGAAAAVASGGRRPPSARAAAAARRARRRKPSWGCAPLAHPPQPRQARRRSTRVNNSSARSPSDAGRAHSCARRRDAYVSIQQAM